MACLMVDECPIADRRLAPAGRRAHVDVERRRPLIAGNENAGETGIF